MKKGILVGLLTVAALGSLAACSSQSASKSDSASTGVKTEQSSSTAKSSDKKTYAIGDKITFEGKVEFTITGVEWTDERNQFEKSQPEKVLKVTYNLTNLSDEDYPIVGDVDLYVGGKKMDSYPNGGTMGSVSAGRTYEGAVSYFAVNGSGAKELEVEPFMGIGTKPAIVAFQLD